MRVLIVVVLATALCGLLGKFEVARAENLNKLYGPSWDCSYMSFGEPIYEDCRKCDMATQDFWRDTPTSGHCVPKDGGLGRQAPTEILGGAPRSSNRGSRQEYFGAAAAGLWRDSDGNAHVATGIAWNYPTMAEAESEAISRCENAGGENCRVVGTFDNGGCGYISVGHDDDGVRYGMGPTEEAAQERCESGGYTCKPPAGGCTSRP